MPHGSKTRLLDAALRVIRTKGYSATTIEDICAAANVTKGSFFHYFKSKDTFAVAAVEHFSAMAEQLFSTAPYPDAKDPLERVLGYVDFRATLLTGELPEFTCLLGTLIQEIYATHPDIRAACDRGIATRIAALTGDIELARQLHVPDAPWSADSIGTFIQSVLQGSFILAKAKQGPDVARENLAHLRRYLGTLFTPAKTRASKPRLAL